MRINYNDLKELEKATNENLQALGSRFRVRVSASNNLYNLERCTLPQMETGASTDNLVYGAQTSEVWKYMRAMNKAFELAGEHHKEQMPPFSRANDKLYFMNMFVEDKFKNFSQAKEANTRLGAIAERIAGLDGNDLEYLINQIEKIR